MSPDFHLIGFDYTNLLHKKVAVDPETKAVLTKEIGNIHVLKSGDTMIGLLTLSGAPTIDLHAATKKYVDDHIGEGGPSGITDASDYDTIQLAINAANSLGNKFVWIPAGTYDIDAPLSLPADGFSLIGAGRKIVTLRATSGIDAIIKQVGKRYLTVGGFRLDGNGHLGSRGIWLENVVWFSKFFDIEIRDILISALYLANAGDAIGQAPYWNLFQNIQCGRVQQRGTHGIYLRGDANLNTFINCTAAGDDRGILLQNYDFGASGIRGPGSNIFLAPDCGGGDSCIGIKIEDAARSNTFFNPYIEGVLRSMEILVKDNVVIGGSFYGNTNNEILAPNGLDCYYYRVGANTYGNWLGGGGNGGGREKQDLLVKINASYPTYKIDIDALVLQVEDENLTGINLTVDITQSGANGLDTGSEAANTWYSIWVIRGSSGTAGLLSTSSTSPSMPAGYTKKRRVGWVRNNSNSAFRKFFHIGDWWHWDAQHVALNTGSAATSWTDVNCGSYVPPTSEFITIMGFVGDTNGAGANLKIRRKGSSETMPNDYDLHHSGSGLTTCSISVIGVVVSCDGSQIIQYKVYTGDEYARICIFGYYDPT